MGWAIGYLSRYPVFSEISLFLLSGSASERGIYVKALRFYK